MKSFFRILSNLNLVLAAMLLFLVLFQGKMSLPPIIQTAGRMHPLLLHLPIGTLLFSLLLWFFRKNIDPASFDLIFRLSVYLSAGSALMTALLGLFLSQEDGYTGDVLYWHRTLSLILAFGSYAFMIWYESFLVNTSLIPVFLFLLLFFLITGSHQGARLTHGDGFITQPLQKELASIPVTEESSLYQAAVYPVFQAKCVSCHNPQKAKGDLDLTTEEGILRGGKNGAPWKAGDTMSLILKKIHLPLEDKKHMPPSGKTQLTEAEKVLVREWIVAGADLKKQIKAYDEADTLMRLASPFLHREAVAKTYTFPAADAALIKKLNDPFCAVFPLDQNSPALQVDFFVREKYNPAKLNELLKIKDQIVVLNMDNMPVTDVDLATISKFTNLEELILNHSSVTSKGIEKLSALSSLQSLAISGTNTDATVLTAFKKFKVLKEVFIWNTRVNEGDIKSLDSSANKIHYNLGFIPDPNELLALNSPIKVSEAEVLTPRDSVALKHQIPGVIIRYTTDGTIPDSVTGTVYRHPIPITNGYTLIRTRAVKDGWLSSPVTDYGFFKQVIVAKQAELLTSPNEKYNAGGSAALIDGKKGPAANFKDEAWIGFREQPFSALFHLDTAQPVHTITMSFNKSVNSFILLPTEVEIWAGKNPSSLKLIKKVIPPPTTKAELGIVKNEMVIIDLATTTYPYYKINARPVGKLPSWHPGKGQPGWVFLDEVFFN